MSQRHKLLEAVAEIIQDYRAGELPTPTTEHVEKWVNQFDENVREPILQELSHILQKTYFSRQKVEDFLKTLLVNKELVGNNPCAFWKTVNFLNQQHRGSSQQEMLAIFNNLLQAECGFGIDQCGDGSTTYLYLDDAIFSGNHVKKDIQTWIQNEAPPQSKLHIISIARHTGFWFAKNSIDTMNQNLRKQVSIQWQTSLDLEDRKSYTDISDVLRPVSIPQVPETQRYAEGLTQIAFRIPNFSSKNNLFTGEERRHLLEQEFFKAGVIIRQKCNDLHEFQRPLGNTTLKNCGFGSLIVTFRNCANNTPLALWAGEPWYPLFRRKTNETMR